MIHTLINNILKKALQDSTYKQIGKLPRFFNLKKQMEVDGGLIAYPGFKASTYKCTNSTTIVIDNLYKFITSNTCLEKINEIRHYNPDGDHWKELVEAEFVNKSVLVQWGTRRAYIIKRILFDEHPETKKFVTEAKVEWTISDYFAQTYKLIIKAKKQPLFEVMMSGKACHLPPEFCVFDGVPDVIRKDPFKMRNIMKHCSKNPEQKFSEIEMFTHELFQQEALKDWGLTINSQPVALNSVILPLPDIRTVEGNFVQAEQSILRKLPIQEKMNLMFEQWWFVYENRNERDATHIVETMKKSSGLLGLKVQDPYWVPLHSMRDAREFASIAEKFKKEGYKPVIVFVLLSFENVYSQFKRVCFEQGFSSQFVSSRKVKKFDCSVASNVLRQMNSKMGGDLFNISFPKELLPLTMIMGIDVCHQGSNSIVGFCASTNKEMSQYHSHKLF